MQQAGGSVEIVIAWVATVVTLLYLLPWAIAASRRSTNSLLVAVLNFFLGWTSVGWLVCLVLSFTGSRARHREHVVRSAAGVRTARVRAAPAVPVGPPRY